VKYGLMLPNIGDYGDARVLADLAHDAESEGWDGFFVWDTFKHAEAEGRPVADAWITLAAIAARTERIRIGPRVSAPPRHRPWLLAQQAVSLDHLSNGRLILGVGSGEADDQGFSAFGEQLDPRTRADMLDESLAILDGLWAGEPFAFSGQHYRFDAVQLLPRPVQQPRIPIWVAGTWPKPRPMGRAASWDGVNPFAMHEDGTFPPLQAGAVAALKAFGEERRPDGATWDIAIDAPVLAALSDDAAMDHLIGLAAAGATWAIEAVGTDREIDDLRAVIRLGPPALATVDAGMTVGS
jgi:alkanesulfonate monooxygenase SsuD/methylene tetrahydromethanopterin reductase-like flavin-dependent oxidoreductase (luciferase family)